MKNGKDNRINLLDDSSDDEIGGEQNIAVGDFIDNHYPGRNNVNDNEIVASTSESFPQFPSEQVENEDDDPLENCPLPPPDIPKINHNIPVDGYNFTYLIFYLLGTTTMCPWNFFVTAEEYWMYKFRNVTENCTDLTLLQKSFTSDLTVTAAMAGTTFLILHAIYGHLISLKFKMIGSMIIILALFIVTTAFVEVNTDDWQVGFFILTMAIVVNINTFSSIMSGGLFGIAGLFPSEYMTAVVSGQSLGGIFTALAFILCLTFGASPKTTAFVYFLIGTTILLISIITYIIMSRTIFFQYHVYDKRKLTMDQKDEEEESILENSVPDNNVMIPDLKLVFTKIFLHAVIIALVLATSLAVYPAITVLVQSENYGKGYKWNDIYFLPVVNYLFFNSGDYLGRILAGLWETPRNNPELCLLWTVLRMAFIPCFLLSNADHVFMPTYITSDATFIILMILFAISNGYLVNIIMITVPKVVMQHEKELASSIMVASMSVGLAIGACCSMFLVQIL